MRIKLARRALAAFAVSIIAATGLVATASPALANNPYGTLELSGSSWLSGGGVDIYSNGAYTYVSNSYNYVGSINVGMKWQCVELAQRLYTVKGWHSGLFPGVSVAANIWSAAPNMGMTTQVNGSITSIVPGDMIIHGMSDSFSPNAGHVAIADHKVGNTVYAVQQNAPATVSYTLNNGTLTGGSGTDILGVVHDTDNSASDNQSFTWYLSNDMSGNAFTSFVYGNGSSDTPTTGDWDGNGTDTIGIVRNNNNERWWHLRNDNSGGNPSVALAYGATTDTSVVGDWDGNGTVTPGVVRNVGGTWVWYLSNDMSGNAFTSISYGSPASDYPVVGDWDGNGTDTIGIVRNTGSTWQWHLRNDNTTGPANISFDYGSPASDYPVVGDWDGNGTDTIGITRATSGSLWWHLRNDNSAGGASVALSYGATTDTPVVGDWDGNGTVTPGVVRRS